MNLSAFQYPAYRRYFVCAIFNVNAVWFFQIAMSWIAWSETGSASFVGLTGLVAIMPAVILGPFFGVMADRVPIVRAFWVNSAIKAVTISAIAVVALQGALTPGLILVGVALIGISEGAHHPLRMALGPRLVERAAIPSVIAVGALNFNLARMITPALAGLVITAAGAPAALWIAVAMIVLNLLILPSLSPRPAREAAATPGFLDDLREGLDHVLGQRSVRQIMLLAFGFFFALRGTLEVLPVIADGRFGLGATGLGQMAASVGAGALLAAGAKTFWTLDEMGGAVRLAFFAGLIALAGLGFSQFWALSLMCTAAMGGCATFIGVSAQGALQEGLDDGMRGRVMSIFVTSAMSGAALGAGSIGTLMDWLGIETTLASVAALVAFGIWFLGWPERLTPQEPRFSPDRRL